jgi:hypothetical protein
MCPQICINSITYNETHPLRKVALPPSNKNITLEISGSHGGEYEDDSLLGHSAM